MKLDVSAKPPAEAPGDVLVLERYAGEERLAPEARRIDLALGGFLSLALRDQRFVKTGRRFSPNARMPSFWSSVAKSM